MGTDWEVGSSPGQDRPLALGLAHVHRSSPYQAPECQAPVAAELWRAAQAPAAGLGGAPRCPAPPSTFDDLTPGPLRTERASQSRMGSRSRGGGCCL